MNRRDFLNTAGVSAALGLGMKPMVSLAAGKEGKQPANLSWQRYNYKNTLESLTAASADMPAREDLLEQAIANIPTPERVQQIHDIVIAHTIAEETNDVEATMATLADNPVYEDVAAGRTFNGHQHVMADYQAKYKSFPDMQRHVTNLLFDKNGCFGELIWEGKQKGSVHGLKPPSNRPKIYLPVSVYWQVNDEGKITRETVYYDQYLMLLNMDIIPDIANKPLTLFSLNPGLIWRREN